MMRISSEGGGVAQYADWGVAQQKAGVEQLVARLLYSKIIITCFARCSLKAVVNL